MNTREVQKVANEYLRPLLKAIETSNIEDKDQFEGRSQDELGFFVLHGFWPESAGSELPPNREYVLYGIRTTVINEWVDKPSQASTSRRPTPIVRAPMKQLDPAELSGPEAAT
jgi:hypothetical protein